MAEKLDGVMLLLFEFMDRQITSNDTEAPGLFEGLVPTLETSILSTHRCKYVQLIEDIRSMLLGSIFNSGVSIQSRHSKHHHIPFLINIPYIQEGTVIPNGVVQFTDLSMSLSLSPGSLSM